MPTGTDNINIDVDTGIGLDTASLIPTIYTVAETSDKDFSLEVTYVVGTGSYGSFDQITAYEVVYKQEYNGSVPTLFNINDLSGTLSSDISTYFYISDNQWFYTNSLHVESSFSIPLHTYDIIKVSYVISFVSLYGHLDLVNFFGIRESRVPFVSNTPIEITFSNAYFYSINTDIYCTYGKLLRCVLSDVQTTQGSIVCYSSDVFSSSVGINNLVLDLYVSLEATQSLGTEVETTSGALTHLNDDIYSTKLVSSLGQQLDIRLQSLYITNFSLIPGTFSYLGDYLSVDIVDHMYDIDTTRTQLSINGTTVSGFFTTIPHGKRLNCMIDSNFISDGTIECEVTAYNVANDRDVAHYFLLSGYNVEFKGKLFFGYNKLITVRGCATNKAKCPNTSCDSFSFVTEDYPSYNLNASISCVVSSDLTAEIKPQSKAFFYGREYEITISNIKDFSGNYMAPVTFKFRIEDKKV